MEYIRQFLAHAVELEHEAARRYDEEEVHVTELEKWISRCDTQRGE